MLSLMHAGQLVGGVLFAVPPDLDRRDSVWRTHGERLSAAFGLAIAYALARAEGLRMTEELVAANRRLQAARAEEIRRRSLERIGKVAGGAAHELNNPLTVIAVRAQMLRQDAEDAKTRRSLETIEQHARRASEMVAELVRFAKPEAPRRRLVSVADWASKLRQYWQAHSSLPAEHFEVDISDVRLRMYVDPEQLTEAANAVVRNALEAMTPENARLEINSRSSASDESVVVSIRDNGAGMSPATLEHAMDPFFSDRPAGRGRGLGLSHACRLVENNGGSLWIESVPDLGTTVHFSLPASAGLT
jgi:signal transduction histidine kinase